MRGNPGALHSHTEVHARREHTSGEPARSVDFQAARSYARNHGSAPEPHRSPCASGTYERGNLRRAVRSGAKIDGCRDHASGAQHLPVHVTPPEDVLARSVSRPRAFRVSAAWACAARRGGGNSGRCRARPRSGRAFGSSSIQVGTFPAGRSSTGRRRCARRAVAATDVRPGGADERHARSRAGRAPRLRSRSPTTTRARLTAWRHPLTGQSPPAYPGLCRTRIPRPIRMSGLRFERDQPLPTARPPDRPTD
jgi:hypothetical protein